jgi:hypothetical protein
LGFARSEFADAGPLICARACGSVVIVCKSSARMGASQPAVSLPRSIANEVAAVLTSDPQACMRLKSVPGRDAVAPSSDQIVQALITDLQPQSSVLPAWCEQCCADAVIAALPFVGLCLC